MPALTSLDDIPDMIKYLKGLIDEVGRKTAPKPVVHTATGAGWTGNVAAAQTVLTVAIPDPGYAYRVTCWATMGLLLGPSVKVEVAWRDNGVAGTAMGPLMVWDRGGAEALQTYYYKTVIGALSTPITGARTLYLVGAKTGPAGNGTDCSGSAYTGGIVTVTPA